MRDARLGRYAGVMFGNQQGPRPSTADTEAREWEVIDRAKHREDTIHEHVESNRAPDAAGGRRRRWWEFWRRSES
jgi:hypothetical protein